MIKLIKYEKLILLCFCKLNSIQDLISKALSSGKISDEEFKFISEEDRNYELQRSEILKKEKKKFKPKFAKFNRRNSKNSSKKKITLEINLNLYFSDQRRLEPTAPPDYFEN